MIDREEFYALVRKVKAIEKILVDKELSTPDELNALSISPEMSLLNKLIEARMNNKEQREQ